MSGQFDARTLGAQAKEALRLRVAVAVVRGQLRASQAVRELKVSRTAVYQWVRAYRAGGLWALRAKRIGRPRRSRLSGVQAATAVRLILHRCPDQLGLPYFLWTRRAVRDLLARRFGVRVSTRTAGRYLSRWGMTPQKPLRRAYEQNPRAVQRWLTEEYPALAARARAEKAQIHWGDQMGLRSEHRAGRSYGRRGCPPVVPGTGRRFGCNLMSTITNRGLLRFMVFRQRFASPVMIEFLRRLIRSVSRKVFLIVDRHPVHRGRSVGRWLQAHARRIEMFFLPDYSPDLNPDEWLNQDVKADAGRQRPRNQAQMVRHLRRRLRSTQRQPAKVRRYFSPPDVAYAAH